MAFLHKTADYEDIGCVTITTSVTEHGYHLNDTLAECHAEDTVGGGGWASVRWQQEQCPGSPDVFP